MYIVTPNIQNPYDAPPYRWMAYPEGKAVEDYAQYGSTPEEALALLLDMLDEWVPSLSAAVRQSLSYCGAGGK